MKEPNKEKPHIVMDQITIAVLALIQLISAYQERQVHQEIWDSLIEIRKDLNQSVESQNLHLQNVQEIVDYLTEYLQ